MQQLIRQQQQWCGGHGVAHECRCHPGACTQLLGRWRGFDAGCWDYSHQWCCHTHSGAEALGSYPHPVEEGRVASEDQGQASIPRGVRLPPHRRQINPSASRHFPPCDATLRDTTFYFIVHSSTSVSLPVCVHFCGCFVVMCRTLSLFFALSLVVVVTLNDTNHRLHHHPHHYLLLLLLRSCLALPCLALLPCLWLCCGGGCGCCCCRRFQSRTSQHSTTCCSTSPPPPPTSLLFFS